MENDFLKNYEPLSYNESGKFIEELARVNERDYNILKFAEELIELSEQLIKSVNKKGSPKAPTDDQIIDELSDVALRGHVYIEMMGWRDNEKIDDRCNRKLARLKELHLEGKYTGRI